MEIRYNGQYLRKKQNSRHRWLAVLLIVCLILTNLNVGSIRSYATEDGPAIFEIGDNVTARLENGVLTVEGVGDTDDFTMDTAPFAEYADGIQALVIEEGITYIGSCLFYGLGELKGELILPESIVGFGDHAFSGGSLKNAPKFTVIRNEFEGGELVLQFSEEEDTGKGGNTATPSQAKPDESISDKTDFEETGNSAGEENGPEKAKNEETGTENTGAEDAGIEKIQQNGQEKSDVDVISDQKKSQSESEDKAVPGETVAATIKAYRVPLLGEGVNLDSAGGNSGSLEDSPSSKPESSDKGNANSGGTSSDKENESGRGDSPDNGDANHGGISSDNGNTNHGGTSSDNGNTNNEGTSADNGEANDGGTSTDNGNASDGGTSTDNGNASDGETSPDNGNAADGNNSSDKGDLTGTEHPDNGGESNTEDGADNKDVSEVPDGDEDGPNKKGAGASENKHKDEPEDESEDEEDYYIEYITEQKIKNPGTLFYGGMEGAVLCSPDNISFMEAAKSAGYQVADRLVDAVLDETMEMELPVLDGQALLPECPEEIAGIHEEDGFHISDFAGWAEKNEEGESLLEAGSYLELGEEEPLYLYSVWEKAESSHLRVAVERMDKSAVYTLIDHDTDNAPMVPAGYAFLYQWQIAETEADSRTADRTVLESPKATESKAGKLEKDEGIWTDIDGADEASYERVLDDYDLTKQIRCMVTAVRLTRSADGEVVMYSDAVHAAVIPDVVYVNQTDGSNTNDGTSQEAAVQTLTYAAGLFSEEGSSVERNRIILVGDYRLKAGEDLLDTMFLSQRPVPVTIAGITADTTLYGIDETIEENNNLIFCSDITFESITLHRMGHFYGNGSNITIGADVKTTGSLYLYGAGRNNISNVGKIAVYSGNYVRIAGYARNTNTVQEVEGKYADITVGGSASVNTIIAGNASGGVTKADTTITVKDEARVTTLVGGSQGFEQVVSPYTGRTAVNIQGGTVDRIYGAGSGRKLSIPTFAGEMEINVSGGTVTDIYGSGSAAYIISPEGQAATTVRIRVTGGTISNIYAAGQGGDGALTASDSVVFQEALTHCGSLTGEAEISIEGGTISNVYASGKGWESTKYDTTQNAYLDGNVVIRMSGGRVIGSIFGGGKGIARDGYENCARTTENSRVAIEFTGGTVDGNIYGGGENARVEGTASVMISGGEVKKNVYGGALGQQGKSLVYGGSTVNMTGGTVDGNLYGGSMLSNDGRAEENTDSNSKHHKGLVFVNLVGGTVSGKVFGGSYRGTVNGSSHLHIGSSAMDACQYYAVYGDEKPVLEPAESLAVGGSVYAGGDYGDGVDYNKITVNGYSHVYVDGDGYTFGGQGDGISMSLSGGVFGSGASCDAGNVRLVTLRNFGTLETDQGRPVGATGMLKSIQRADQVCLINTHVQLTGMSDVANQNQTALYSLNRIGEHGGSSDLNELGNSLVLQDGSTLILESATIEVANLKSVRTDTSADSASKTVTLEELSGTANAILLNSGTVFRISRTTKEGGSQTETYGEVAGYSYIHAADTAEAYVYARPKIEESGLNKEDGGFSEFNADSELGYTNVSDRYRYWRVSGKNAESVRHAVLTAQNMDAADEVFDGYSVAEGEIELPPAAAGSKYRIKSVAIPTDLTLINAAIDKPGAAWVTADPSIDASEEAGKLSGKESAFGLLMSQGDEFDNAVSGSNAGKVISNATASSTGSFTIIGTDTAPVVNTDSGSPKLRFYLTYPNGSIEQSKDLGTVEIVLERISGSDSGTQETIIMGLNILTKAAKLQSQSVDLYATQDGSYTGRLIIPVGSDRTLKLTGVELPAGITLERAGNQYQFTGNQIAVTMQPDKTSDGWKNDADLLTAAYDISEYGSAPVLLGDTDSRYEAPIDFILYNAADFREKDTSYITLKLQDGSESPVDITLQIHWQASISKGVLAKAGKQYNSITEPVQTINISPKSSFTAVYTLGRGEDPKEVWMEFWKGNEQAGLPSGTKLTLWSSGADGYYYYVTSAEGNRRIQLADFMKMGTVGRFTQNLEQNTQITVIVDFDSAAGNLEAADYSLRLQNRKGADSTRDAEFTVDESEPSVILTGREESQTNIYTLTLELSPGSDIRLAGGAAVVLYPEEGKRFPAQAEFYYDGQVYAPFRDRVYLMLGHVKEDSVYEITMDLSKAEIEAGEYKLRALIYSAGIHAGSTVINSDGEVSYKVSTNARHGLKADMEGSSRMAEPGTQLRFNVQYMTAEGKPGQQVIKASVQKKTNGSYEAVSGWEISDDAWPIPSETDSGTAVFTITVPPGTAAGTYRINFTLGDKTAPYNIIVTDDS